MSSRPSDPAEARQPLRDPATEAAADSPRGLIDNVASFFGASLLAQAFGLVRSFAMPFLFAPAQLGVWNLMSVIVGYAPNLHLGVLNGLTKMLPAMQAEGRVVEAGVLRDSVLWVALVMGGVGLVALVTAAAFAPPTYAGPLLVTGVTVFLVLPYTYQFCLLRAGSRFDVVSKGMIALSFLGTSLILGLAIPAQNKVVAAGIGLSIAYGLTTVYWFARSRERYLLRLDRALVARAFRVGAPLSVMSAADSVFMSMDRWVVTSYFGAAATGHYALAIMAMTVLSFVPNSLFQVLFPSLISRYAAAGDARALASTLERAVVGISVVMLLLSAMTAVAASAFIQAFLPDYRPAQPAAATLLLGTFFLGIGWISNGFIVAVDRQRVIPLIQAAAALAGLGAMLLLTRGGFHIAGVATGMVIGYAVQAAAAVLAAERYVIGRGHSLRRPLLGLLAAFAAVAIATGLGTRLVSAAGSRTTAIGAALVALVLVGLAWGLALRAVPGSSRVLRALLDQLRRRVPRRAT